jgi:hypothetical protein
MWELGLIKKLCLCVVKFEQYIEKRENHKKSSVVYAARKKLLQVSTFHFNCELHINHTVMHRWALSPISVISNIGLSLISELPISD